MSGTDKQKNIERIKNGLSSAEVFLGVFELNPEDTTITDEILEVYGLFEEDPIFLENMSAHCLVEAVVNMLKGISEGRIEAYDDRVELVSNAHKALTEFFNTMDQQKLDTAVFSLVTEMEAVSSASEPGEEMETVEMTANCGALSQVAEDTGNTEKKSTEGVDLENFAFFQSASFQHITSIDECTDALVRGYEQLKYDSLIRALQGLKGASVFIQHEEMALIAGNLIRELMDLKDPGLNPDKMKNLLNKVQEFSTGVQSFIDENLKDKAPEERPMGASEMIEKSQAVRDPGLSNGIKASKVMRIPVEKVNQLMNAIEELLIINSKLGGIRRVMEKDKSMVGCAKLIGGVVSHFEKNTEMMYDKLISMRMAPVHSLFKKFKHVIEDLSVEQNKKIDVDVIGEETEVDRLVLEILKDPLIHLIRNAVDHGVETPDERMKSGKSPVGKVVLRALNDVNSVVIEIEDDGKGIDWRKIRDKGVGKGLFDEKEASLMTEREALDLIFRPGFSTAEKVTNISGRGVGMDVVKTAISSMDGSIDIDTAPGRGSCFIIRLPLAMTMVDALIIRAGREIYSIPSDSVEKILKVPNDEIRSIYNRPVISLKNRTLPFGYLTSMIGDASSNHIEKKSNIEEIVTLLLKNNGKSVALGVDAIIGKQKVVIKNLGGLLGTIPGISGASIHDDGSIMLMLDSIILGEMIQTAA